MTKFYDAVYSFERVGGYQFVKLYISMFEKWLESPQWLLAVSKPEVRMRVTSAWGQECKQKWSLKWSGYIFQVHIMMQCCGISNTLSIEIP